MDILLRFIGLSFFLTVMSLKASTLPVEAFSSLPDVSNVVMSPSGQYVASLVNTRKSGVKGALITIYNATDKTSSPVMYADNKKFVVNWLRWANDRHLLISARFPAVRYGTPTTETRMLIFDQENRETKSIFPRGFLKKQSWVPQFQDQIIDLLPHEPNHILVEASFNTPQKSSVYKVDLTDKSRKRIERDKERYVAWLTDRTGLVRLGIYFKDTTYKIMHRAVGSKSWKVLWEYEALSDARVSPMGFDGDANILFVNAYHEGRMAVFKVDLSDPELHKELVYKNDYYDVSGSLVYSLVEQRVVALENLSVGGVVYFDEDYQALKQGIDRALPDTNNVLLGSSHDGRHYLLKAESDIDSGSYYLGNRDNKTLDVVAYRYRRLVPELMAEKRQVSYSARDGQTIEAYLTTPKGVDAKSLATIIFPHGGPISFDGKGFDYWTQYFASRGYAVLQMNFRGSHGYGHDFMSAGFKRWGLEMQQDVEDGTRWLIKEGVADEHRICVVGASYGGYAALMEARDNSELYQCAVSFAGVSDAARLVRQQKKYRGYKVAKQMIGSDLSELKKRSPLAGIEGIQIPILLVHGKKDRRVRVIHSQKMHKALTKAGKDVQYIEQENGDHYLSDESNRHQFFQVMDTFLDKHLGQSL